MPLKHQWHVICSIILWSSLQVRLLRRSIQQSFRIEVCLLQSFLQRWEELNILHHLLTLHLISFTAAIQLLQLLLVRTCIFVWVTHAFIDCFILSLISHSNVLIGFDAVSGVRAEVFLWLWSFVIFVNYYWVIMFIVLLGGEVHIANSCRIITVVVGGGLGLSERIIPTKANILFPAIMNQLLIKFKMRLIAFLIDLSLIILISLSDLMCRWIVEFWHWWIWSIDF